MSLYLATESWISVQWMTSSEATTFPRFTLIPPLHRSRVTPLNLPGALITQSSQPVTSRPCDAEPSGTSMVSPFFFSMTRRRWPRPAMTRSTEGMLKVVVGPCGVPSGQKAILLSKIKTKGSQMREMDYCSAMTCCTPTEKEAAVMTIYYGFKN